MIRKILKVNSDTVSISIPENYIGKVLEIIAFPTDERLNKKVFNKKTATFNAINLDTKNFRFNRDEANER